MNKKEAAEKLGVSAKTIERLVAKDKLHPVMVHGRTGLEAQFDEAEIDALKTERDTPIHNAHPAKPSQDETRQPNQYSNAIALNQARGLPAALVELIQTLANPGRGKRIAYPMITIESKMFLTVREAAALSGLGVSHLEDAIKRKKLKAHNLAHIRGRRIKRQDLDNYTNKL
jgi:excisionase family DNA binding protein